MVGKRKSVASAHAVDERLQRVTRALENVARLSAASTAFAMAHTERFPLPAIAFKNKQDDDDHDDEDDDDDREDDDEDGEDGEDGEDELLLPLGKHDTRKIKARSAVRRRDEQRTTAWEVDGALLETRNPKWSAYLAEWLRSKRSALSIAPGAVVDVTLNKMVLVEAGSCLYRRDRRAHRGHGVFGKLVVTLPSKFKGGDIHVPEPQLARTVLWRPGGRKFFYGITLAAFYDSCHCISYPVEAGRALCLVYDLVTSTPSEVPLFGGSDSVQQSVESALVDYFESSPASLAKRLQIESVVYRSIDEVIAPRQFVYPVTQNNFNRLCGDQDEVAQSLAAFCAQSGGEYVLYHANLICSSTTLSFSLFGNDNDDCTVGSIINVTLTAPWIKHGTSEGCAYPPIFLGGRHEIAPTGQIERAQAWYHVDDITGPSKKIVKELHRGERNPQVYETYALVVMPAAVEHSQIAKLSIDDVVQQLTKLLTQSRDKALQLARRVIESHSDWQLGSADMKPFSKFIKIVVEINDRELFANLLLVIHFKSVFPTTLFASSIKHFGWDACADSLVKRVGSTSTFCGRVYLIVSAFYAGWGPTQLNPLLDSLLSLHPWTNVNIGQRPPQDKPDSNAFANLLVITDAVASDRIRDIVSVAHAEEMVDLVLPALTRLRSEYTNNPRLLAALDHADGLLTPMVKNLFKKAHSRYAGIRIPDHCPVCEQLQSFLPSSVVETTLEVSGESEVDHIIVVITRATSRLTSVQVTREGTNTVRLKKKPGVITNSLLHRACVQAARVKSLLREA